MTAKTVIQRQFTTEESFFVYLLVVYGLLITHSKIGVYNALFKTSSIRTITYLMIKYFFEESPIIID
jgi:hypothetical protein